MQEPRHLRNAPIKEAIVDVRTKLPDEFRAEQLCGLRDKLKDRFPTSEEVHGFEASVQVQLKEKHVSQSSRMTGQQGFVLRSTDGRNVVNLGIEGFSYSRLGEYPTWEQFFGEAMDLWHAYAEETGVVLATRLAVRYINHLTFPTPPPLTLGEFLAVPPASPVEGASIGQFLTRVLVRSPDNSDITAFVTQASFQKDLLTVVLDIEE